jgi:hypothetical protein
MQFIRAAQAVRSPEVAPGVIVDRLSVGDSELVSIYTEVSA